MALMTMPAPCPPACCACQKACASSSVTSCCVPGISGTPQRAASARAWALSPNSASCAGVGPMKRMPASAQAVAKSARSLRKP
jgi:hypothetical protein